jgi:hypothetical protein
LYLDGSVPPMFHYFFPVSLFASSFSIYCFSFLFTAISALW